MTFMFNFVLPDISAKFSFFFCDYYILSPNFFPLFLLLDSVYALLFILHKTLSLRGFTFANYKIYSP